MQRPDPPDETTKKRWLHTSTRYLLLTGDWERELLDWMKLHIAGSRLTAWGAPDMSANPFKQSCREMAVTYHQAPQVTHPDAAAQPMLGTRGLIVRSKHFLRMRKNQYLCQGLREIMVHPYRDKQQRIWMRQVLPHNVYAWADPSAPGVPLVLWELRTRIIRQQAVFAWDQYDISDPENPSFRVMLAGGEKPGAEGLDVTAEVFQGESFRGAGYWWRLQEGGTPILPYGLYHADETEELFEPFYDRETVRGTLTAAMLNTQAVRGAKDCAGSVVLGVNADFSALAVRQGTGLGGSTTAAVINMEPGSMHEVLAKNPDKDVSIVVVPPGADIEKLDAFARKYEMRVAMRLGLKPADPTAQHGDPRSGYALALDRGTKRELQQQLEPMYRDGDEQALRALAVVYNRGTKAGKVAPIPEEGYSIEYARLPLSPEEEQERRARLTWELKAGVRDPWQVIQEYLPSISEDEARRRAAFVNVDQLASLINNGQMQVA